MKDNLIIRPLRDDDRQGIETFFDRLTGEGKLFFNHNDCNRQRFRRLFSGEVSDMEVFVAEDPESKLLAGLVFLFNPDCKVPSLGVATDDAYRGCGLGQRLVEFIHEHAEKKGMGGILLNVHFANAKAQSLYLKMGYTYIGISLLGQMMFIKKFPLEKA